MQTLYSNKTNRLKFNQQITPATHVLIQLWNTLTCKIHVVVVAAAYDCNDQLVVLFDPEPLPSGQYVMDIFSQTSASNTDPLLAQAIQSDIPIRIQDLNSC